MWPAESAHGTSFDRRWHDPTRPICRQLGLGTIVAAGVVTLLFSHVFINIGMNIRLMPVTGIPLPLLSYGGSSVLGSLIAMGLLQNVHLNRKGY